MRRAGGCSSCTLWKLDERGFDPGRVDRTQRLQTRDACVRGCLRTTLPALAIVQSSQRRGGLARLVTDNASETSEHTCGVSAEPLGAHRQRLTDRRGHD